MESWNAVALGLVLASGPVTGQTLGPEAFLPWDDAETVEFGAQLYTQHCASCHGANLEGEPNWQVRRDTGRLPAPPHDETGHTWHHPDAMLFAITAYGSEAVIGNGYESDMAGFSDTIGEDGVIAVLAYIKSTWPDQIREIHADVNARFAASYGQ